MADHVHERYYRPRPLVNYLTKRIIVKICKILLNYSYMLLKNKSVCTSGGLHRANMYLTIRCYLYPLHCLREVLPFLCLGKCPLTLQGYPSFPNTENNPETLSMIQRFAH